MGLAQFKLFPNKGHIWINPAHVAFVREGRHVRPGSGAENAFIVMADMKLTHQVHGAAAEATSKLKAAEKR
jgi:hypothetical protein